jgi:hypothetical protein
MLHLGNDEETTKTQKKTGRTGDDSSSLGCMIRGVEGKIVRIGQRARN